MHAWEAIQKAIDYLEEHLQEEIPTETLAEMVSLSPFYFQRLFKRLVNKPLKEYIKLRRMARVIEELDTGKQRILDIALNYGFSSHGNFTRTFKETYGITPEEYKKTQPFLNTFIKPEISMNYVMIDEGIPLIVGNIVLEIQRKNLMKAENYLGLTAKVDISTQIPVGESTGIDIPGQLWTRFHAEKEEIVELIDPDIELGMSYIEDSEKGVFTYFAGGLSRNIHGKVNDNFINQELPTGDYIVCKIEAESFEKLVTEALDKASKYLFDTWLPNHQLAIQPFSAEKYYTNFNYSNCMEIWVKPLENSN